MLERENRSSREAENETQVLCKGRGEGEVGGGALTGRREKAYIIQGRGCG